MTLEQLRIFVAVADRLHFTRAAQAMGLTQSAVSASVAALESWAGIALFHRIGRRVELTSEGTAFLAEARGVLRSAARASETLRDLSGLVCGRLTLMGSQTVATYWLPPRLHAFRQAHPGVEIALGIGNTAEVAAALLAGEIELGVVEGEVDSDRLEKREVGEDRMVLVLGGQYRGLGDSVIDAEGLRRLPWVIREPGSGTRAVWEALLARHEIGPSDVAIALELPSNEAVGAAVEAGAGASVLSRLIVANSRAAGKLVAAANILPPRRFTALTHADLGLSRAARAFLGDQATRNIYEPSVPPGPG